MYVRIETTKQGKVIKFGVPSMDQRDDGVLTRVTMTDQQIKKLVQVFTDYEQISQHFENIGSAWQVELDK